jgi:hypothetical protein
MKKLNKKFISLFFFKFFSFKQKNIVEWNDEELEVSDLKTKSNIII